MSERRDVVLEGARQSTWLVAPERGDVTADFPACTAPTETVRAHSADFGPCWFATVDSLESPLGGRFDLLDAGSDDGEADEETAGTLYCSNDVEVAVRERLGAAFAGRRYLAASDLHDTAVSILYMEENGLGQCLADTCSARGFVTREISTMPDYGVTRSWAEEFFRVGFDGIAYEPRSTPGPERMAYAIFGPSGSTGRFAWSPHPTWWEELIDSGVVIAHVSSAHASIVE